MEIPRYAIGTGRMEAAVEWISRGGEIFSSCWSLDSNGLIHINKEVLWIGCIFTQISSCGGDRF
jgi:hypothetical protein